MNNDLPGAVERDAAIALVSENAGEEFKEHALAVLERIAREKPELTSADVYEALQVEPHDYRALGAVMRRGQKAGWIEATLTFIPDPRPHVHRTPLRVWRSKISV